MSKPKRTLTDTEKSLMKTFDGRWYLKRQKIVASEKNFNKGIDKLIDFLDNHLSDAAFGFEFGVQESDDIMTEVEELLNPRLVFDNKTISRALNEVPDRELSKAGQDAHDYAIIQTRETHFKAGVLMGARLKGASRDELKKLAEHW